jgi:Ser/Thr protein kinase RdoA (MazF antagonist)
MLKRRAPNSGTRERLGALHAFQLHLSDAGVPIARLRRTPDGTTAVDGPLGTYEMFEWVDGERWSQRVAEAAAMGAALGSMLRASMDFAGGDRLGRFSYHRAGTFDVTVEPILESVARADPDTDIPALRGTLENLLDRARRAYGHAEHAGLDESPWLCVHGDTHPGNVIFDAGRVRAIIDFDGVRCDHRVCEAANALVHFGNSPIATVPQERWQAELDLRRIAALSDGLGRGMGKALVSQEREALPWLMIESCTLESIVPIARSGRFAHLRADGFLAFIDRKTAWIESNARAIASA